MTTNFMIPPSLREPGTWTSFETGEPSAVQDPRDPYRLSAADRHAYRSGAWLGAKTPEHIKRDHGSPQECAAELAARVRLELEATE